MSEVAWLIETNDGMAKYWSGEHRESFTHDPNLAVRFARREDAQKLIDCGVVTYLKTCCPTEHMWCDGPARTDAGSKQP